MRRLLALALGLLLASPAPAATHRLGLAAAADGSTAWKTGIGVVGGHGGAFWSLHGKHAGLQVELRDQFGWSQGGGKNLPGITLSYAHLFGSPDARTRGLLTAGVSLFYTDLLPVLPFLGGSGGVEWTLGERQFLRAEGHVFLAPAPAVGLGPRLSFGWSL